MPQQFCLFLHKAMPGLETSVLPTHRRRSMIPKTPGTSMLRSEPDGNERYRTAGVPACNPIS